MDSSARLAMWLVSRRYDPWIGRGPSSSPVDLSSMTQVDDQHNEVIVLDFDDDPIITYPVAPQPFLGFERAPDLSRVLEVDEAFLEEGSYPSRRLVVQPADLFLCLWRYPNPVSHSGHSTSSNGMDSSPDRRKSSRACSPR